MAKIQSENGTEEIEQVKQIYHQAKELAEKLKMHPLLANCCLGFGQFYTRRGENEKARTELLKAIGLYRSFCMLSRVLKAEAILSEVS